MESKIGFYNNSNNHYYIYMKKLEKKVLPDPGKYSIFLPDMDYIYFDNAEQFPFEPHNKDFSLTNAWWLSEASFVVYAHPGFARMAFKLAGLDNFKFFNGTGTECMIAWNRDFVIISFRGTELNSNSTLYEVATDLNAIPTPFSEGGKVHKGFLKALDEIWSMKHGLKEAIDSIIEEDTNRPIWITGHSLGGALAALCFSRVPQAAGLYIYGAPRIGDMDFINITKSKPIWRIEHDCDPITQVPPNLPAIKFCFEDIGELIFIDRDGEISNKRPELTIDEHKELIKTTISTQRARDKSLTDSIMKFQFNIEHGKKIYNQINCNIKKSYNEWESYIKKLNSDTKINLLDHMPIYYSGKLWNQLIKKLT